MTVYETDCLLYKKDNMDSKEFKNAIRKYMCEEYQFKDTGGSY